MPSVSDVGSSGFRLDLVGSCADLTENGCRPPLVVAQFCRFNPNSCPLVKVREVFGSSVVETLLFGLSLRVLFAEVYYHLWSKQIFTRRQISFSSPAHNPLCWAGFEMFLGVFRTVNRAKYGSPPVFFLTRRILFACFTVF